MEKELFALIQELLKMDELHEEYTINDTSFAIDTRKQDDNTVVITVSLKANQDKKEFEDWVNDLDDSLFSEVWESLSEEYGLKKLNDAYEGENYKEVIKLFKNKAKMLAAQKVDYLTKLFNL